MTPGFFGALPGDGVVALGLEEGTVARLGRWWEMVVEAGPPPPALAPPSRPPTPDDPPVWRLHLRAGLFSPDPVAGVLRLVPFGRAALHPAAILRPGPLPEAGDPWFDAAEELLRAATEADIGRTVLARRLAALPPPRLQGASLDGTALLWRDDWVVREVALAAAADLARLPVALLLDPGLDDAEAA